MFNDSNNGDAIKCFDERPSLSSISIAITFIIVAFCGLITNFINIRIFTHKQWPTTTLSIYLTILCIADIIMLLTGTWLLQKMSTLAEFSVSLEFKRLMYKMTLVLHPMTMIAFAICVMVLCALSVHYLLRIASPLRHDVSPLPKLTICIIIVTTILIAIVINVPHFFELRLGSCYDERTKSLQDISLVRAWQNETYYTLMTIWRLVLLCLTPYSLFIVISILIFIEVRRPFWIDDRNTGENQRFLPESSHIRASKWMEIRQHLVVITLSFFYVVASLPWFAFTLYSLTGSDNSVDTVMWAHEVSNMCLLTYQSAKILIYYFCDRNFRAFFPGFGRRNYA